MSPIEELIHTIDQIRSVPAWEPAAINAVLAVELQRVPTTTPRYKLYEAPLASPFLRVRLGRPVQAGPTKWSVSVSIHQDVSVGFKELKPRLPVIDKLVPPMMPTPGWPPIWSHSVLVSYPECGGSFRFARAALGADANHLGAKRSAIWPTIAASNSRWLAPLRPRLRTTTLPSTSAPTASQKATTNTS